MVLSYDPGKIQSANELQSLFAGEGSAQQISGRQALGNMYASGTQVLFGACAIKRIQFHHVVSLSFLCEAMERLENHLDLFGVKFQFHLTEPGNSSNLYDEVH